jgi:hypothetical protein
MAQPDFLQHGKNRNTTNTQYANPPSSSFFTCLFARDVPVIVQLLSTLRSHRRWMGNADKTRDAVCYKCFGTPLATHKGIRNTLSLSLTQKVWDDKTVEVALCQGAETRRLR